ncbi:hypothetical protein OIO90_001538 [Microbotryomycetes sp. JL221]|nr:hypothetical protein OIO90_001538 [Microbotryomycetes sp. JL221]
MSPAVAPQDAAGDKQASSQTTSANSNKPGTSSSTAAPSTSAAQTNGDKASTSNDVTQVQQQSKDKGQQGAPAKPASPLDGLSPQDLRRKLDAGRKVLREVLDRKKKVDQELAALESSIYAFEGSYLADQLFPASAQSSSGPVHFGNIIKGYDSYLKATGGNTDRKRSRGTEEPRQSDRMFSMSSATYQKVADRLTETSTVADSASDDETSSSTGRRKRGQRRTFFGLGEIVGVLSNPAEVLRSLQESKRLLEEARQELQENAERAQSFHDRPRELQALERALGSVPAMTVLFGASSVGKTALCRQVLSDQSKFHVLHFDLRLAGFADLQSLFTSLASQMESYFNSMPDMFGKEWGWDIFEKESYAFKHDKADVLKRIADGGAPVSTADIARLLEQFQSSLLKYWEFEQMSEEDRKMKEEEAKQEKDNENKERKPKARDGSEKTLKRGPVPTASKEDEVDLAKARTIKKREERKDREKEEGDKPTPPAKKVPVLFLDEAHKSDSAMKTLLDSMLVLTKQDRLCHVIHATSDPFYMHWLRQMNVMQHANILSVGDCSRKEGHQFFEQTLKPRVPTKFQAGLNFEELYEAFGGKLAHLSDYVTEYINSDGKIKPRQSSHFLQAHSLLNLQLIHSMPLRPGEENASSGFEIYSALAQSSPHASPSPFIQSNSEAGSTQSSMSSGGSTFAAADLLLVMARLCSEPALLYFPLCRELGAKAVDGMIRGRILELRWSKTITPEGTEEEIRTRDSINTVGPLVVPTTPVVKFAMRTVLQEYADELEVAHGLKWDETWSKFLADEQERNTDLPRQQSS